MPRRKKLDVVEDPRCCHHFSGLINEACRAGVRYSDIRVEHAPSSGRIASFPCMPDDPLSLACELFRYSTDAEVLAERRASLEALRKLNRGISPCCNAGLVPVGGGWEACAACQERVVHSYRSPAERGDRGAADTQH